MRHYLVKNLCRSLRTSPFRGPLKAWVPVPIFAIFAAVIGFSVGLLHFAPLISFAALFLPFTLLVFPSLLEEAFFRGVLIPLDTAERGRGVMVLRIVASTALFVAWHPANALAFNPTAIPLFLDPWFLLIVALLGITCGYAYMVSKSLWVPVLIHWGTVMVWVLVLGGRNLVLEF
jgi:predicted Abi (CAAX) family protease